MKNIITGKAFVLGNDIDTDQIIPAAHLVYKLDDPGREKELRQVCVVRSADRSLRFAGGKHPIHQRGKMAIRL